MTNYDHRIRHLLKQYANNRATEDEINEMLDILKQAENDKVLETYILELGTEVNQDLVEQPVDWEQMWTRILKQTQPAKIRKLYWRMRVAASILLMVGLGSYFLVFNKPGKQDDIVKIKEPAKDVKAPTVSKGMITLANGQKVYLDSVGSGTLAMQGNVKLVKLANGQIAYQTEYGEIVNEIKYNTLENPRGSKVIDITLTDGSRVWLNAGSSVKYPIVFAGDERKVFITGEAYFEVTHDVSKPFFVSKGDMQVQVIGTHFNINAYEDENNIKVTLLEGSVKVSNRNANGSLKPGQQANVTNDVKIINDVDLEAVMSWKNGRFEFGENTSINDIMRQVSRWYDVDIEYKENINQGFGGSISRQLNVSKVLENFELTGRIRFKIEGRKIVVMK